MLGASAFPQWAERLSCRIRYDDASALKILRILRRAIDDMMKAFIKFSSGRHSRLIWLVRLVTAKVRVQERANLVFTAMRSGISVHDRLTSISFDSALGWHQLALWRACSILPDGLGNRRGLGVINDAGLRDLFVRNRGIGVCITSEDE